MGLLKFCPFSQFGKSDGKKCYNEGRVMMALNHNEITGSLGFHAYSTTFNFVHQTNFENCSPALRIFLCVGG